MKITNKISKSAEADLKLLRAELKKAYPDTNTVFELISGHKYTIDIKK